MALVPATITVNFNAQYVGPHRVCFRIVGAPTYTCTVPGGPGPGFHPVCSGGGLPCSYDITIMVDNETCDQVDYEGYVQAACEDLASLTGRDPFAVSFIPDPACNRYEVTCINSPVLDVTNLVGGSGYTNGNYNGLASVGGGGVGATFDVTVAGGIITVITVATPGSGYTSAPTIDLTSIPFAPGVAATYTVNLTGCSALTIYDCSGATVEILPLGTFQPAETYDMCGSATPTIPADYSIIEDGNCLCNCTEISLTEDEPGGTGSLNYTYIDCNDVVVTGTVATGATLGPICMVTDSLTFVVVGNANGTITVGAACNAVP